VLDFGKYKGQTIQQVMKADPNYLHWALQNISDFKLNKNALLLLPAFKPTTPRRGQDWSDFDRDQMGHGMQDFGDN
jgi:hypothetical protein